MPINKYKIFDTLIEGIQVISPEWTYLYVNPASAKQFNFEVSDLLNKKAYDVFPRLKGTEIEAKVRESLEQGLSFDQEISFGFPHNSIRWYHLKLRPIEEGVLLMMQDITKEKEINSKLELNEMRLRELYNAMHDCYALFRLVFNEANEFIDLEFVEVNAATSNLIGYKRSSFIGRKWTKLAGIVDDYFKKNINHTITTGEPSNFDVYLERYSAWFAVTIHPINDEQVAIIASNITKRKNYEKELQGFNKRLEGFVDEKTQELSEALEREKILTNTQSKFLSIAAHELKAPLNSIIVCLDVLKQNPGTKDDEAFKKYSHYIGEEMANLLSMVSDFISPTNKIFNQVGGFVKTISLNKLINNVMLGMSELTGPNQNLVHIRSGDDEISINKDILRRILLNLLNNAIKYSSKDIEIHTIVNETELELSVTDQGIGIPEKEQEMVFQKYFRATNVDALEGTGLGLVVVKNYVEILGGTMDFVSKENKGTTFNITLPLTASDHKVNVQD